MLYNEKTEGKKEAYFIEIATYIYIGNRAVKTSQFKCCIGDLKNVWSAVWVWIENVA